MIELITLNQRKILYHDYSSDEQLSNTLPDKNWVCFIIINEKSHNKLEAISNKIIENNACYVCCAGNWAELMHDTVDENLVLREVNSHYVPPFTVITTWHADGIENGLWYAIFATMHDFPIQTVVCFNDNISTSQIEISEMLKKFGTGYIPNN